MDKFVGIWVSTLKHKIITLTIKKITIPVLNSKVDYLEGYLVHKDNGVDLEASEKPVLTRGTNIPESGEQFDDIIYFNYQDLNKGKSGKLKIVLSKTNPDEFTTVLMNTHGKVLGNSTEKRMDWGFTLPTKLVFARK